MEHSILWQETIDHTKVSPSNTSTPLLIDFFNPEWIGCQQMDTVTYPDEKVIEIVNKHSSPFRIPHTANLEILDRDVEWTPALFMMTPQGILLQESIGFMPPEELVPWILLGKGKMQFQQKEMDHTANLTNSVLSDYPNSHWAPEALYWKSVALFRSTQNASALQQGYDRLKKQYPDSIWAKKAMPYRLL